MTEKQIKVYIRRYFPTMRAQCSVHGNYRGSIQIFYGHDKLLLDVPTRLSDYSSGDHQITEKQIRNLLK